VSLVASAKSHVQDGRGDIDRMRRALEGVLGMPATEGNVVEVLRNGNEIFPAMLDSIAGAAHTVDFLTFVYWSGEIGERVAEALAGRARARVRVRVLLDAWGAHPIDKSLVAMMESAGVQVRWFRPLSLFQLHKMNRRTHRKVLIVDETIGFTGGVGIADVWNGDARNENEWRDTHFRVQGPAVDGLRSAFLDNWLETNDVLFESKVDRFPDQPQSGSTLVQSVRGASESGWSDISTLFLLLLQLAQERIRITTAYFVPDSQLNDRLCAAAERGVDVQILLPGPHIDKRFVQKAGESSFARLLDCGVTIWEFQPSMLHAKIMTIDGILANIGSANLDARSTELNEEINLVALDSEVVRVLDAQFDEDLRRSQAIVAGQWENRPLPRRVVERVAGLFRHEM
jgi:cardiolipin synthase